MNDINKKINLLLLCNYDLNGIYRYLTDLENIDIDFKNISGKVYDACIVLNETRTMQRVHVRKGNVFALMQEPGEGYSDPFMFKKLYQYDKVFSPILQSKNTSVSHGYLGFFIARTVSDLYAWNCPDKNKIISCIMSDKKTISGHRLRFAFKQSLQDSNISIDYFGRESNKLINKEDGLLDYHYSIAIENASKDYYFTEKINDCFLCYTIPFYYGCTNIDKFFPSKSYVWIDITDPQKAIRTIRDTLEMEDPKDRLPYLEEARSLVLEKYHLGAFLKKLPSAIKNGEAYAQKTKVYKLTPAPTSEPFRFKINRNIARLRKISKLLTFR